MDEAEEGGMKVKLETVGGSVLALLKGVEGALRIGLGAGAVIVAVDFGAGGALQ